MATKAPQKTTAAEMIADTSEAEAAQHKALAAESSIVFNAMAPTLIPAFRQLGSIIQYWNTRQGFWESDNFGEKIALIHSEISEALEAHRKNLPSDHLPGYDGVVEELADAVIRIFDLAGKMNAPLGEVLIAKLQYNLTRPHKHGKAY